MNYNETTAVTHLYRVAFGRDPTDSEVERHIESQVSLDEIEHELYSSSEFNPSKTRYIFPTLSYMTKQNGGEWPIHWVSLRGMPDIIKNMGEHLVGCEIGTNQGWSLVYLLNNTNNIAKMYAIDPYTPYDDTPTGGDFVTQQMQDHIKRMWYENTRLLGERVELITDSASDAAHRFGDESLDFLFIDGDHNYESVKQDMQSYYSKVKSGGIFSGHDYDGAYNGDVSRAVHEFMIENGIDEGLLKFCETDVWYWVKP